MKLKGLPTLLLPALCLCILFSNCASLTGFETGKTSGKDQGYFSASLNANRTPDFNLDDDDESESFFFPNIEVGVRYGLAEKIDIGLKANSYFNIVMDGKFQVVGDQDSEAAVSLGAGIGTFGPVAGLWHVQIPAYFSFHPSEDFAFYLSPRHVTQFAAGDLSAGSLNYFGGNAGIEFGKTNKFGFDIGAYNISSSEANDIESLFTFGFGLKITF